MFARDRKTPVAEWWWTIDRELLTALLMLLGCGMVLSFAASPPVAERLGLDSWHFIIRHAMFAVPAVMILFATSFLSRRQARIAALIVLVVSVAMTWATLRFGAANNGASRWLTFAGQTIQPSEFVKPAFAVIAAWLFAESMVQGNVPGRIMATGLLGLIVVPLLLQPDVGQTILIVLTFSALLFLSGISWWFIGAMFGVAVAGGVGAYLLFPHVARRIDSFLNPEAGDTYQVEKAMASLHEGGWFGRGPGEAVAKRYLPDAHADYIFSAAAGEFGILFCLVLVGLIAFIALRALVSAQNQQNLFARLAASVLAIQFGLQSIINLAVNLDLVPSKGMTLPFVSYGGTSMLAVAFGMGLMLALTRRRPEERMKSGVGMRSAVPVPAA